MEDYRRFALEEIARLRLEIHHCAHCASLQQQIVRLLELLPPEPLQIGNLLAEYAGYSEAFQLKPPPGYTQR